LGIGARVGAFEVVGSLGAGGMGEVYRARDTRLDRDVAIKILPDVFLHDPDRVARFQREAKTLAALNHPNIAAIYGVEGGPADAGHYVLVLELVEGPTLADRIAEGPIPVDEALPIARQIAEALEAAHDHGIVHRDLKPANIKLRPDGAVKVLDFGLAKSLGPAEAGHYVSQGAGDRSVRLQPDHTGSPTITSPMLTGAGVILGTAAYMSPEQARGRPADKRADIWAFGCVLYEMLTGARAFKGDDISDVYVAILRDEPDWSALPPDTPAPIRRFLRRALAKDPKLRLREAGSAILEIEDAQLPGEIEAHVATNARPALPAWQRPAFAAAIAVIAATSGISVWFVARPPADPRQVVRSAIPLEVPAFTATGRHIVAISPDGSHIAYVANSRIYLRRLDQMRATPVSGTEGGAGAFGRSPFFSPDGQSLGFWAEGALKRVTVTGGALTTLGVAENPFGAWWGEDGAILFGQGPAGIWQVPATGGKPEVLFRVESGEFAASPQRLPDSDWVLFTVRPRGIGDWNRAQVVVQSPTTGERIVVIDGGRDARYVPTGHLVYAFNGVLHAAPFDVETRRVTGGAVAVVEGVGDAANTTAASHFAVAGNGSLVYAEGLGGLALPQTFVWVDRAGRETPIPAPIRPYQEFDLSADGTRIAVRVQQATEDIWVYDLRRQVETRLTFDAGNETGPIWTPDGRRVAFGGGVPISWRASDGTGPVDTLWESAEHPLATPAAFAPDGRALVAQFSPGAQAVGVLSLDGNRSFKVLLQSSGFTQRNAALSPDGRWLAYESNESGPFEVFVRPFPDVNAGRWQVSSGGGRWPVWSPRSPTTELFYVGPRTLMALSLNTEPTFTPGAVTPLFGLEGYTGPNALANRRVAVAPDGQRFLFLKPATVAQSSAPAARLLMVENWFEELKQRVPVP
jgi:serine/threonine-protein kinase